MKFKALLLILLGMALSGQLLAPMAMAGCMGFGGAAAMSAGEHHGMHMASAGHMVEHTHHVTPAPGNAEFRGDCCQMGHTGHCPMASCLTAALPGLVLIDSPHARPAPPADRLSTPYNQHTATHYRPPIFA